VGPRIWRRGPSRVFLVRLYFRVVNEKSGPEK
jgi:hypothetical protein